MQPKNTTLEDWEKRFDDKFHVLRYEQDGENYEGYSNQYPEPNAKEIKTFISQVRESVLNQILSLPEMQEEKEYKDCPEGCSPGRERNWFRTDLRKALQSLKEK